MDENNKEAVSWNDVLDEHFDIDLKEGEGVIENGNSGSDSHNDSDDSNNGDKSDETTTTTTTIAPVETTTTTVANSDDTTTTTTTEVPTTTTTTTVQPSIRDEVKSAITDMATEVQNKTEYAKGLKAEIKKTLYPEGVDTQLRDSSGDPITGIRDMVKLVNPDTNALFTEAEAAEWLLSAQQKLNKDIQMLDSYIGSVAEANMSLKDGVDRIKQYWDDVLVAFPDVADAVFNAYNKTLIRDPKSGIVVKAPVDIVEYYDIALTPYRNMQANMAESKAAEEKAALAAQGERGDFGANGITKPKGGDDDGWNDAYDKYFNNK